MTDLQQLPFAEGKAGRYLEALGEDISVASACHNTERLLEQGLVPLPQMGEQKAVSQAVSSSLVCFEAI